MVFHIKEISVLEAGFEHFLHLWIGQIRAFDASHFESEEGGYRYSVAHRDDTLADLDRSLVIPPKAAARPFHHTLF